MALRPGTSGRAGGTLTPDPGGAAEEPHGRDGAGLEVYGRILRQRWRLLAITFVVVTAGVAVGSLTRPSVYRATATLELRRQAAEVVPVEAFSQFERISDQYLQTQYSILRGPSLVRRVVARPALGGRLASLAELENAGTAVLPAVGTPGADTLAAQLAAFVAEGLVVDAVGTSRIVRIHLELEDPVLAADVVNGLVEEYLAMREEAAARTLARLGEEGDSVRASLLVAEAELQRFVEANGLGGVIAEGDGEAVPVERLRRLQQELTAAETEAYQAEAVAAAARERPAALAGGELIEALRKRVAELEVDYARLRSTFTDSFPRTRQVGNELRRAQALLADEEQRVLESYSGQHEATLQRRSLLQTAVAEQRRLVDGISARMAEYERLRRDLESRSELYASLQQKRKEAAIAASLSTMDVAVLDAARPPLAPIRPLPKRDIPLGAVIGLALGVGLVFVRHLSDRSVRTIEDVQGITGAPLLAAIPATAGARMLLPGRSRDRRDGAWHRIDRSATLSALDEAFSGLRTSMLYDLSDEAERRTLLITSSRPAEGKTTVATNLAISLARLGRRVLLVDADVRRPSLHHVFSFDGAEGLTTYLCGTASWRDVVRRDVVPGLDVIPAGRQVPNPPDRLSSPAMGRLLAQAGVAYDFVLLDAPGLFVNVPDARILAHLVDGVILVVRSGVAERDVVQRVLGQIENLVGVVLNQMDARHMPGYYHGYGEAGPRTGVATEPLEFVTEASAARGRATP